MIDPDLVCKTTLTSEIGIFFFHFLFLADGRSKTAVVDGRSADVVVK